MFQIAFFLLCLILLQNFQFFRGPSCCVMYKTIPTIKVFLFNYTHTGMEEKDKNCRLNIKYWKCNIYLNSLGKCAEESAKKNRRLFYRWLTWMHFFIKLGSCFGKIQQSRKVECFVVSHWNDNSLLSLLESKRSNILNCFWILVKSTLFKIQWIMKSS